MAPKSERMKELWADPEWRKKTTSNMRGVLGRRRNAQTWEKVRRKIDRRLIRLVSRSTTEKERNALEAWMLRYGLQRSYRTLLRLFRREQMLRKTLTSIQRKIDQAKEGYEPQSHRKGDVDGKVKGD